MSTLRLPLLLCLSIALAGIGCAADGEPVSPEVAAYCPADAREVEARIDALLDQLTLREKSWLMHGTLPEGNWPSLGVPDHGLPGFAMIDGPRGVSDVAGNATAFPVGMARGATWDPSLERRVGEAIGVETRALGANVLLAPTINLLRHPRWGRAQETYGEDTHHVGVMGSAFIEGVQSENVIAVAKHFAANSIEDTRLEVDVRLSERTLREVYLPHFRRAVQEARVGGVMSAYNRVNGTYCGEHPHLLREILKEEWAFAGFVVSDFVWGTHDTLASLEAGLDVEMPIAQIYGAPVVEAVESGDAAIEDVDAAVRRILRAQLCYRLDSEPAVRDPEAVESDAAAALSLEVARRSLVLLENRGPMLPLSREGDETYVVIGELADLENIGDEGSSAVEPSRVVTDVEGLEARAEGATIVHLDGGLSSQADRDTVASADAVIVIVGSTASDEGEDSFGGGDRSSLELASDQIALIEEVTALSSSVALILHGGGAFTMEGFHEDVEAIVMAWYAGDRGGLALADLLFGEVAPSGRLPISFARREEDLPPFDNESLTVEYGYLHGYRHLDDAGTAPLYPFGYGLSYTTFTVEELSLERSTVTAEETLSFEVRVTNTGARRGIETVQAYVGAVGSSVERAPRDLRAFGQIELDPGESAALPLEVRIEDLAIYDADEGAMRVEPGTYRLEVGQNVADLPLTATFEVGSSAP